MTTDEQRIYSIMVKQGNTLDAKLYKLTCGFTLADWKAMRTPAYWKGLDAIPVKETVKRLQYQLSSVLNYTHQTAEQ
jgi:hypothetical protein